MPYLALNQMFDEDNRWGQYDYLKGGQIAEISDEVIDVITEHFPRKLSPASVVLLYLVDAAYSSVPDDETAYAGDRSPGFYIFNVAMCPSPEILDADRQWARELWSALRPHMVERTYVNALDEEQDYGDVDWAFGIDKYSRLAQIKATYDPDNIFHSNKPAAQPVRRRSMPICAGEPSLPIPDARFRAHLFDPGGEDARPLAPSPRRGTQLVGLAGGALVDHLAGGERLEDGQQVLSGAEILGAAHFDDALVEDRERAAAVDDDSGRRGRDGEGKHLASQRSAVAVGGLDQDRHQAVGGAVGRGPRGQGPSQDIRHLGR
jgi:hypothetical protein